MARRLPVESLTVAYKDKVYNYRVSVIEVEDTGPDYRLKQLHAQYWLNSPQDGIMIFNSYRDEPGATFFRLKGWVSDHGHPLPGLVDAVETALKETFFPPTNHAVTPTDQPDI